jgi:hypothetical protein
MSKLLRYFWIARKSFPKARLRIGPFSFSPDYIQHFFNCPNMVCDSRFHRGSDAQTGMHAAEVVVHEVNRNRVKVIFDFLAESVRESREATHLHSHR